MGVPWHEAVNAGNIMATKLVSNEFVAMTDLAQGNFNSQIERQRLSLYS